jgi:hypothetical protein
MKIQRFLLTVSLVLGLLVNCKSTTEITKKVDQKAQINNNIKGKILAGYQGWFNAKGDGSNLEWKHYGNKGFEPGKCAVDFWPDLTEFDADETYITPFSHPNGDAAKLFSSANAKTVNRHFKWMKEYNIDGVFVQRFVASFQTKIREDNAHKVFDNCFNGAKTNNRLISVMYDLSGSKAVDVVENTKRDWKQLVDKYSLNKTKNPAILTYKDKPVVAIWGVGFEGRNYTLENVKELIDFFKNDPKYGGCTVLLGVPTAWRTLNRDATSNPMLLEVIKSADIVHPWTPGRYKNIKTADNHKRDYTIADKQWCDQNNLLYMPVVFPGFSWSNLKNDPSLLNQIPRLKGDFLWRQFYNNITAGVETMYVAMFDEMDEGTCIFKVDNNPPSGGGSSFLNYEGLPSDYYLWLTGQATKMLRKEIPVSESQPTYSKKK